MLKIKPEIWTKNDGTQYVMMSMQDFEKVQELIEDAGLSRILTVSRKRQANGPATSLDEMKHLLGVKTRRNSSAK
jgi:hypothetical protein